ncbi:MAG: hypothetical protein ACTS3F_13375 [Phycisphaerales bacterium]
MYDARIMVPSRANGGAALLLGGGSVSDMHWTVPASIDVGGRTVMLTSTGGPLRDADALTAALLERGFHVMQWSSIHRDDPRYADDPAYAEGLAYEEVRGLARRALDVLLEHELTAGMPVVLVGQSLGGARAIQISEGRVVSEGGEDGGGVAGIVLISGAYVSPYAERVSLAGSALLARHGLAAPMGVAEVSAHGALLDELGVGDGGALDVDGDGVVRGWEFGSAEALARMDRGDRSLLAGDELLGERHPGWLVLDLGVPVLAVFGGTDPVTVHGPVMERLARDAGAGGVEVRIERGLGHGLGVVEAPPARDAEVIQGVAGPIRGWVVEVIAEWCDGVVR